MKKIIIDLDGDLRKAIAEIDDLIAQIESFPIEVAVDGALYAEQGYDPFTAEILVSKNGDTMPVVGYGKSGIMVQAEPSERKSGGAVIHASGEEVCFAEWGTGLYAVHDPTVKIPTGFATYSDSHGGKLRQYGYWFYDGYKYVGAHPTFAMTHTIEHLREHTDSIARDYFK